MNLTPEDKAVGKDNFFAAVGSKAIRRDFLRQGIAQSVRAKRGLGSYYFGYGSVREPVKVGVLGTGDEGSVLIGAINPEYVQVTAIADIRPYSRYRAFYGDQYSPNVAKVRPGLMSVYGWKTMEEAQRHVRVYHDYRDLLVSEPDIEAVIIALPLHLHAPAAIAAMKAGKHVLTEKLMAHSVHECKEMALASVQAGKHLATGHQRHYNILYDNAVKLISSGVIGDLHYIRAQWHRGNLPGQDSWQQPLPLEAKRGDALAGTLERELEAWQKRLSALKNKTKPSAKELAEIEVLEKRIPQKAAQLADVEIVDAAKQYGYEDMQITDAEGNLVYDRPAIEELIRWRLWDRTGGGLMAELGSHQLDAASIFIAAMHDGKKQYPLSVGATANRPIFPPDRDVDDHVYCLFEFPAPGYDPEDEARRQKKIGVAYASINGNGWGGYGETVFGTKGTLLLERETDVMLYRGASTTDKTRVTGNPPKLVAHEDGDEYSAAVGTQALSVAERGYTEQIEHWAWCVRENPGADESGPRPRCHPKVALGDAVIALTTNRAARQGQRVDFQKEWFDPDRPETPEGVKPDLSRYA